MNNPGRRSKVVGRRDNRMPLLWLCVLCVVIVSITGCGNVYLKGDALTAAETSTMDAYQAADRSAKDPNVPPWLTIYQQENFKQWRFFVRSANKDPNWGPKIAGE